MNPVQTCLVAALCVAALYLAYTIVPRHARRTIEAERDVSDALSLWCESLTAELEQHKRAISSLRPPALPRYFTTSAPRDALMSRRTAGFSLPRFLTSDEQPGPGE